MPASDPTAIGNSTMMPVRLRGHHFLCILAYRGFGYTPAFVATMTDIVRSIGQGRPVMLVDGQDDICHGFTPECRKTCDHDCSKPSTVEIDLLARDDIRDLLPVDLSVPFVLTREHVETMRDRFAAGAIRSACVPCSWRDFCTTIAADGFSGVTLFSE